MNDCQTHPLQDQGLNGCDDCAVLREWEHEEGGHDDASDAGAEMGCPRCDDIEQARRDVAEARSEQLYASSYGLGQ